MYKRKFIILVFVLPIICLCQTSKAESTDAVKERIGAYLNFMFPDASSSFTYTFHPVSDIETEVFDIAINTSTQLHIEEKDYPVDINIWIKNDFKSCLLQFQYDNDRKPKLDNESNNDALELTHNALKYFLSETSLHKLLNALHTPEFFISQEIVPIDSDYSYYIEYLVNGSDLFGIKSVFLLRFRFDHRTLLLQSVSIFECI